MEYNKLLINYINKCNYDEPIFLSQIKDYFNIKYNINSKSINVYINRLVHNNKLVQFKKGVYYKPKNGNFGYKILDVNKVINKKYICDENGRKGYFSGAYLFNIVGLTTQIPKKILIVTNECPNNNDYDNKTLGVVIRKPKISINNSNYKYFQLFDILINKDNIKIEVDNEKEIIYKFIKENNLDFEIIFELAYKLKNIKIVNKLYQLGGK